MRGKRLALRFGQRLVGITPAHAGKTRLLYRLRASVLGSPPRMRGKRS